MPFTPAEAGGLAPGQAVECPSEGAAILNAKIRTGAVGTRSQGARSSAN